MYNSKLAVAVRAGGKILREHKEVVYLPFGTEYSIFIKNLNTVRAQVNVFIDGVDVAEGDSVIVGAGSNIDLTRFITNQNLKSGNAFKFIERTDGVEKHRGIGIEDGLIRVEFQFERPTPSLADLLSRSNRTKYDPPYTPGLSTWPHQQPTIWCSTAVAQGASPQLMNVSSGMVGMASSTTTASAAANYTNDVGVTVPGSVKNQQFQNVAALDVEDEKHAMVLKLVGETPDNQLVVAPITVKSKPKCVSCGHVNKSRAKFCSECGTGLAVV